MDRYRTLKAQGKHLYLSGVATANQRQMAFRIADEKGIDLAAFIRAELELNEPLMVSKNAMSAIIDALLSKQIKAKREAA